MNKQELVEKIAKEANISKARAKEALDATTGTIASVLKKNDSIALPGFGSFSVSKRKAREGRNPATGEKIQIPAMKVPKFKASKNLKDALKK